MKITTDLTHTKLGKKIYTPEILQKVSAAHAKIHSDDPAIDNKWVHLPRTVNQDEISKINETAAWIRSNCDVLLVIGIGGSYLGAYAGLQLLTSVGSFPVEFLGTSFDAAVVKIFLEKYHDKRICVNVVSKSGTTMEISAAFNIMNNLLKEKYPDEEGYKKHIVFTTDKNKGFLRDLANSCGITSFTIPDGVGGRYSVLSAVGFLPFACAGLDINHILQGALRASEDLETGELESNEAYKYAVARYLLHTKAKKDVEVLASFHERLGSMGQWWQQLFGESEGKNGKGLFPASLVYTRDLHSMGQFIQQGKPVLFETFLNVASDGVDIRFNQSHHKSTEVAASSMDEINQAAYAGTLKAHVDAGVPVIILNVGKNDCFGFGYMVYFFEITCAMSAYLLDVNPFDQPGVEFYKSNMRDELNKNKNLKD